MLTSHKGLITVAILKSSKQTFLARFGTFIAENEVNAHNIIFTISDVSKNNNNEYFTAISNNK
jgi:hypothetical protein